MLRSSTQWLLRPASLLLALCMPSLFACRPPRHPPRHPALAPHGSGEDSLQLPLGRPGRPGGLVLLRPGDRYDTALGERLSWDELTRRLATARVVFVGESHDEPAHHRVQAALIARLARPSAPPSAPRPRGAGASRATARPASLLLGMEMFFRGHAPAVLRRWVRGKLSEDAFIKAVNWRRQWGMSFAFYRPVFEAARDRLVTILGLNVPLPLARKVGRQGLRALTPAEQATLPRLHLAFGRHRRVFRALLGLPPPRRTLHQAGSRAQPPDTSGAGSVPRSSAGAAPGSGHGPAHGHRGLLQRLFEAQVLRDEVMATEIVRALDRAGPGSRMVVLVGNGHLLYHTGVNNRLRRLRPSWPQATVICLSTGGSSIRVSRGLGDYLVVTRASRKAGKR